MTLFSTLAPYAAAYVFLSVCVALVVGRLFRNMNEFVDTVEEADLAAPGNVPVGMLPI